MRNSRESELRFICDRETARPEHTGPRIGNLMLSSLVLFGHEIEA